MWNLYQVLSTEAQNLYWKMTDILEKGKHGYLDKPGKLHRHLPKEQQREKSVLLPQHCYLKCKDSQSTIVVRGRQKGKNAVIYSFLNPQRSLLLSQLSPRPFCPCPVSPASSATTWCHRGRFVSHVLLQSRTPAVAHLALSPLSLHPRLSQSHQQHLGGVPGTWQSSAGSGWVNAATGTPALIVRGSGKGNSTSTSCLEDTLQFLLLPLSTSLAVLW